MSDERIDVHQHLVPPAYADLLRRNGFAVVGGRDLPEWSVDAALEVGAALGVGTAMLSLSTPGVSFLDGADAVRVAEEMNDYAAGVAAQHPGRFGYFATLPMPDVRAAAAEAARSLDTGAADGVVLLANSRGHHLGAEGQDALFAVLDEREAVVLIHPSTLPGPEIPGVSPFATDFLLDTTRAAYLLVRNGYRQRYPRIRFILSHAGGMVPYVAHRLAITILSETGRSIADSLDDLSGFYFDTALSSSPAALPSLVAFAKPGHVLFGSDWPFAPVEAGLYFAAGLENYTPLGVEGRAAIERTNALRLFPRLGDAPALPGAGLVSRARTGARRAALRAVSRAMAKT